MHPSDDAKRTAMRPQTGGASAPSIADAERVREALTLDRRSNLWTGLARMGGILPAPGRAHEDPMALLRGRGDASGSGSPHGGLIRLASSPQPDGRPRFDTKIPSGGYGWWYVDAISEDGQHALTIIAFIGSVFSPFYKRSGRHDPLDHACLNVALYGPQARWAMTERKRHNVKQSQDRLQIGASVLRWTGEALEIDIEERDKRLFNPFRRRVSGTVRITPEIVNPTAFALDPATKHRWHCLSPKARIEVDMKAPDLTWSGSAYLDSNFGSESLEEGFRIWHWSRAHSSKGAMVCYEGVRRDGSRFASALRFAPDGKASAEAIPELAQLPRSKWLVERSTRSDNGAASVVRTWEDTPFYSRSEIQTELLGENVVAVQESLDLDRFRSPVVQFMLPYRMPRSG